MKIIHITHQVKTYIEMYKSEST